MIKKLISTTDRLLEIKKLPKDSLNWTYSQLEKAFLQAEFVKQKPELWMFIPCKLVDGVWKEFKKPKEYDNWLEIQNFGGYSLCSNSYEYHTLLDKVLFLGIEFKDVQPSTEYNYYHIKGNKLFSANNQYQFYSIHKNIEDLVKYDLQLTPTAIKQIGY